MTRILVLSATTGYQLRSFGDAARDLEVELVFATDRCHRLDDPWRDSAVAVRFHEEDASAEAIVAAAGKQPVDGVIAVGDRPVVLAARAAHALGLPGNRPDGAAASANKKLARERFAAAGLPVPWFYDVPASMSIEVAVARARFPAVVKPLGLSGSRGVIRADSPGELRAAIARVRALLARRDIRAIRSGLEETLLIEGFIHGQEYAIEGILTHGELQVFAIFDKPDPLDGPFFEETIYVTPSSLDREVQRHIGEQVARASAALGLTHGAVHAECRAGVEGIFMLEIAARPIGGLCSKVLRFVNPVDGSSLTLEHVLLQHAAGRDVAGVVREAQAAGVMMIPIPRRGLLKRVEGIDAARAVAFVEEVAITARQNQLLEPLPEAGSYLGFIFAHAPTPDAVVHALKEAHQCLTFKIETPIAVALASDES